jgi:hypothetical protein
LHNQGFYVYRNRRLILKATWFRLIKKEELNKLIRVQVDIPNSLDNLWRIDVKKSGAQPPEKVRKELKSVIKRIEGAGRMVFTRRASKIKHTNLLSIWSREVEEGKIRYRINEEFPLIKNLLNKNQKDISEKLAASIELINKTFPYDLYFADAANDKNEFHEDTPSKEVIINTIEHVMNAYLDFGFNLDEIFEKLEKTEIPGATPELIKEVIKSYK